MVKEMELMSALFFEVEMEQVDEELVVLHAFFGLGVSYGVLLEEDSEEELERLVRELGGADGFG